MNETIVRLDVRPDIQEGREPFSKIMAAVAELAEGQSLLLIAPFEPAPLFGVMANRGFAHQATPRANGDWEVLFTREREPDFDEDEPSEPPSECDHSAEVLELDVRGLEPPEPMVQILEALPMLPRRAQLMARTDRRPVHLLPQLEERGFTGEPEEQSDGSYVTMIRRKES